MITNYISLNGRAAGPIQIGASGAWLKTTTAVTAGGQGRLSFLTSLMGDTFCQLQAGEPSPSDPNGVVTVKFLENYGFKPGNVTIDLSSYVTKTTFDTLSAAVIGSRTSYPTNAKPVADRLETLEHEVNSFESSTDELEKNILELSGRISVNAAGLVAVNNRIDNLNKDPFQGAVILIAGGAKTG